MVYVWEEAKEGGTKEIIFDLSFDVHQVQRSWRCTQAERIVLMYSGWQDSARVEKSQRGNDDHG